MTMQKTGLSRRSFMRAGAALGVASGALGLKMPALAQSGLPDIQSVLDGISVKDYVRADYRKLYDMSDEPLWDPAMDWIRTVDWEKVREEQAGKTVRFAIGAADQESAAEGLKPFEQLSGIKVELVPIPDDSFYDKAVAEFISGNASFDALQFFSPWLGDFAAPGFLAPLDDYAAKWGLPLDDFYDTYRLNYGYFGGQLVGIPFDCDIQMVHLRKSIMEPILGGEIDRANSVPTYDELIRISGEANKLGGGVAGVGLMLARGFWATYTWEHIAAQAGLKLFDENWNPTLAGDAGMKAMDIIMALQKNAIEGTAGAGWGENRAAWLGGQIASSVSWQDSGTQAMRPDQSKIVGDFVTIYEPRIEGGVFAPPNIAGSTSCVAASSQNPEGAFLMLAFLTTGLDHGHERGQRQWRRSGLQVGPLQRAPQGRQPADEGLGRQPGARLVRAAPARHVRDGAGSRQRDQPCRHRPDLGQGSPGKRRGCLEAHHAEERVLGRQGSRVLFRRGAWHVCGRRQAAAVLRRPCRAYPHMTCRGWRPPSPAPGPRRQMRRRSARLKRALPYLLVGPAVVYLLAITLYPGIFAIYQSLYVVRFVNWTFTGLGNYEQLLTDREFWAALGNTAVIGGISLVLQAVIAMSLAYFAYRDPMIRRLAHRVPDADALHALGRGLHLETRLQ